MKHSIFDTSEIAAAWQSMKQAQAITLLAHLRPDADSLGACAALGALLTDHGKSVEIIYPSSTADPLPFTIDNLYAGTHTQQPDLLICCDASTDERIYTPDQFAGVPRIIIDHHLGNKMTGIHRFIDTQASSTCEIVFDLISAWKQNISKPIANILLFGMITDTLCFRLPNTSAHTMQVAGKLMDLGAELTTLTRSMTLHDDPAVMQLWGELLSTIEYTPDHNALWTVCTQDMLKAYGVDDRAISDFISMLSQTMKTDITLLFSELSDGTSKASLRAKTADVRSIAQQFGGGGHKLAAGITSNMSIGELVKKVTAAI